MLHLLLFDRWVVLLCLQCLRRLGPALIAFDRKNLTGPFSLDLSSSIHRAVAWRLQLAALQDTGTSDCRWGQGWGWQALSHSEPFWQNHLRLVNTTTFFLYMHTQLQ